MLARFVSAADLLQRGRLQPSLCKRRSAVPLAASAPRRKAVVVAVVDDDERRREQLSEACILTREATRMSGIRARSARQGSAAAWERCAREQGPFATPQSGSATRSSPPRLRRAAN